MKSLFGAQDVLEIVENGYDDLAVNAADAERNAFKEVKKKDFKALFYIQQYVDSQNFERISKVTVAPWKNHARKFVQKRRVATELLFIPVGKEKYR
jgi:hypothetical protein